MIHCVDGIFVFPLDGGRECFGLRINGMVWLDAGLTDQALQ